MIRELPVDSSRIQFVATGHVTPVIEWVDDGNGGRKPSDQQARDTDTHDLMWTVDAMADGEEFDRAEVVGIQLPAPYQPVVKKFAPVPFQNLRVRFTKGRDGNLRNYWSASGVGEISGASRPPVASANGEHKPAEQKAGS